MMLKDSIKKPSRIEKVKKNQILNYLKNYFVFMITSQMLEAFPFPFPMGKRSAL